MEQCVLLHVCRHGLVQRCYILGVEQNDTVLAVATATGPKVVGKGVDVVVLYFLQSLVLALLL
jgi:hypothetical protein